MIKFREWIAGVFMIALPFYFEVNKYDSLRIPKLKMVVLLATFLSTYFIATRFRYNLAFAYLVLGICVVFHGLSIIGAYYYLWATAAIVTSYLLLNLKNVERFIYLLSVSGVLNALYGYIQMANLDFVFKFRTNGDYFTPIGFLGQQTLYGPFLSACALACLFGRKYVWFLFCLPPIYFTRSSFTYAAFLAGLLVYIFFHLGVKKFVLSTLILVLIPISMIIYGKDEFSLLNDQGRFKEWSKIYNAAVEKPIWGWGPGTFKVIYHKKFQTIESKKKHGNYLEAHNDYLELFFEFGLIGVLTVLILIVDFFRELYRKRNDRFVMACGAIFILFLINAIGSFPFKLAPQGLLALWCWVIVVTKDNVLAREGKWEQKIYLH